MISACVAAVGGILLTLFVSGAYPNFGFWTTSGEAIFMILLGGSNVFLGPLVGTVILRLLNDITVTYTSHTELVLGIVILILVLGLRKGPLDLIAERLENRRQAAAQAVRDAADAGANRQPEEWFLMLKLENLKKSFGGVAATRDVTLDFADGSLTAVIGPNGAGKTTLFNLITGRFPIDSWPHSAGRREYRGAVAA